MFVVEDEYVKDPSATWGWGRGYYYRFRKLLYWHCSDVRRGKWEHIFVHRQDDGFLFPCDIQKALDSRIHLLWTGYGGPLGPEQVLMHTVVEGDEVRHGLVDRNVVGGRFRSTSKPEV